MKDLNRSRHMAYYAITWVTASTGEEHTLLLGFEDRFEGYVFALVLQAARKEGAAIRLENRNSAFNS